GGRRLAARTLTTPAPAQILIFPLLIPPGAASGAQDADNHSSVLSNTLLKATFINENGHLKFGGCPELGLKPGTEIFTITLGDEKTTVAASEMTVLSWKTETLTGDAEATVGSERFPGQAVRATLAWGDLEFEWCAILRDGSHYLRTELVLTAKKDVAMHCVVPMIYEVDAADAPSVIGNTRGAVLASSTIFAGLETPTGINSVETPSAGGGNSLTADTGFSYSSWKADTSGDTQPSNPAYWTWAPGDETPAGVTALGFSKTNIRGKRGFVKISNSGTHTATFTYSTGTHGLNIIGVDLVNESGDVVASDYHIGFTGGMSRNNTFTLDVPSAGTYLLRYFVEIATETITSTGTVRWSPAISAAEGFSGGSAGGTEDTDATKII
ncbi:MAG: hypothetical protein K2O12_06305, partial [Muribaculaceae bacterium]|nr:hypothetical protein [Muribaculaceae bacterium]